MSDPTFAQPAVELNQLGVATAPTAGLGLSLDETGKIPAGVLPKTITGRVASAGTVTAGTGFTVSYNGVATYTVTFTTSFAAVPVVLWQATASSTQFQLSSVTVSGFVAVTQGGAGSDWNFIAMAVA